jgi:hypothetical protein
VAAAILRDADEYAAHEIEAHARPFFAEWLNGIRGAGSPSSAGQDLAAVTEFPVGEQ